VLGGESTMRLCPTGAPEGSGPLRDEPSPAWHAAQRMEPETLFALEGLATAAQAAAADLTPARLSQTETTYGGLRAEASALNARHGWATDDEFEAVLPTIASREEVRALNEQLSPPGSAAPAPQPAELVRLLLLDLAGWATGIRLAGQAFDAAPPEGQPRGPRHE
jgi:hypothetical protein